MPKKIHRRRVLKTGLQAGAIAPFLSPSLLSCSTNESQSDSGQSNTTTPLNILILGGTSFLGPHQIAYAIGRGHQITTFTRGKTLPTIHQELFKQVTSLVGDREDDLTALESGTWDVVIDNSGRKSEWTKNTAELLKDRVGLYLYVSSTGVY